PERYDRREVNARHSSGSGSQVENSSIASRANSRNCSVVKGLREVPMTRQSRGRRPSTNRWYSAGTSLRLARSPLPPKITMTCGSAVSPFLTAQACRPCASGTTLVPAEPVPQGVHEAVAEGVGSAGREAAEHRQGDRGDRDTGVD